MKVVHQTPVLSDKTSTGRRKFWQGFVAEENANYYTYTEYWQEGSARQQSAPTLVLGKNIGRSNETSPREQAVLEIDADAAKKQKKGYVEEGEQRTRTLELPMLAHSFEKRGHDIKWPCFAQPKLDGLRCLTDGERFWSRQGNLFPDEAVRHLKFDTQGLIFDGELMLPQSEYTFEQTVGAIKAYKRGLSELVNYHVFDVVDTEAPFASRLHALRWLFATRPLPDNWLLVETSPVVDENAAREWMGALVEQGYEGIILRNVKGKYKPKHRSADLQKWKPFVDDEFEIIGCEQGTGKDAETAILICRTKEGKEFSARPKGSYEYRHQLWLDRDELINAKSATITYQNLTSDGVPRFPVAKCVRDYE